MDILMHLFWIVPLLFVCWAVYEMIRGDRLVDPEPHPVDELCKNPCPEDVIAAVKKHSTWTIPVVGRIPALGEDCIVGFLGDWFVLTTDASIVMHKHIPRRNDKLICEACANALIQQSYSTEGGWRKYRSVNVLCFSEASFRKLDLGKMQNEGEHRYWTRKYFFTSEPERVRVNLSLSENLPVCELHYAANCTDRQAKQKAPQSS